MTPQDQNPLLAYFQGNRGRMMDKMLHYFDAYHRHFARFRGTRCTLVEIGVYHGGSLQMWKHYLGPQARIIGVDVNPRCKALEEEQIEIAIGDQGDPAFLARLRDLAPSLDILIDDGGHTMQQQLVTFREMLPHVQANGVYLCEDTHTSYWREFGGGFRRPGTFIEVMKELIDHLTAFFSKDPKELAPSEFTRSVASMHFYDSMVVIEKQVRSEPRRFRSGQPSFTDTD